MEQSRPDFLSRETRDEIQFYQTWIDEVLRTRYNEHFTYAHRQLERIQNDAAVELGLSDQVASLKEIWREKMDERTREIAQEFQKNIFETSRFRVGILVDGEVYEIDGVAVDETGAIVPTIAGGMYTGTIEEVMFDR